MKTFEPDIKSLTLVPSEGGVFEVTINGELAFSKKSLGRHVNNGEIKQLVQARLGK